MLLALIVIGSVILIKKIEGDGFNPEIIDPNQVPVTRPDKEPELPPAGTSMANGTATAESGRGNKGACQNIDDV